MPDMATAPAVGAAAYLPLAEAMHELATRCDGARADDGEGFSAGDAPLGHYLADAGVEDEIAATAAWQLARKYKTQLRGYDIDFDELPVPAKPEMRVSEIMLERRQAAKEAAAFAAASFCVLAQDRGKALILLGFPYEPDMVAEARDLPGRAYHKQFAGRRNVNTYPASSAADVRDFCVRHGITLSPEVAVLAENPPAPEPVRHAANVTFSADRQKIEVRFDGFPTPQARESVKTLPGREWDADRKIWTAPVRRGVLLALPGVATTAALRLAGEVAEAACAEIEKVSWNRRASSALAPSSPKPIDVPGLAGSLKDHQLAGLEFIAANRRVLVGDLMGLGKTLLSLAALASDGAFPAVVVCKTSLRLNWLAEVAQFFPGLRTFVASGNAPEPIPADAQVIIIGFDVLKDTYPVNYIDGRGKKRTRQAPGWLPALIGCGPRALVVDESHFGKEADARRSQAMEALGKDVAARNGLVLALTGTAVVNRPLELVQQLKILGRLGDFGTEWDFKYRYCGPVAGAFGTDFSGSSNELELHRLLREYGIYLRRGKEALNLPALTIRPVVLEPAEFEGPGMKAYRDAERHFMATVLARAAERGVDLSDPETRRKFCEGIMSAKMLVELNLLRDLVGSAKTGATSARVRALVTEGEKVMIAAHHKGAIAAFTASFGALRIQGGQSTESVEADKRAFQSCDVNAAPVITVSTTAGGVGHTLTAAANGVMAELPWTWAEIEQMAARLHRIGQKRPVDFQILLAPGTVDDFMWDAVSCKREVTGAVLDGERRAGLDEQSVAADVISRMLGAHAEHIAETSQPGHANVSR